jgi:hypothetical protein
MPGRFDQYAMIALLEEVATQGQSQGSGITRLWANMEWALEDFPGVHDILEYEARVNYVLFCKPNCKPTTRHNMAPGITR